MLHKLLLAVVITGFAIGPTASVKAENKITLTNEVKQRLMELKPMRGAGVNNTAFDGRPVLVTFFASW